MRSKISKGVLNNHNTAYLKPIRPTAASRVPGLLVLLPAKEHNREYYLKLLQQKVKGKTGSKLKEVIPPVTQMNTSYITNLY